MTDVDMISADPNPTWFDRTTWAMQDWRRALDWYWASRAELHRSGRAYGGLPPDENLEAQIAVARTSYRGRVLTWYWALCLPVTTETCVPDEVADLLAEEWDISTSPGHPLRAHGRFFEYLERPIGRLQP